MHISFASIVATLAFLSPLTAAANIGRSEIEARNNVAACKAILIALKASQFCSSFVPIKDVTSTETRTGASSYTKITVTAPCIVPTHKNKKRVPGTTPIAPSTTPAAPSTTPAAPSTTASKCSVKGVQPQIASFGCSVIKEACTAFVKPKTVKVSTCTLNCYEDLAIDSPVNTERDTLLC